MASNDQKMTLTVQGTDGRIYHLVTTAKNTNAESVNTVPLEEEATIQCMRCPKLFCTKRALRNHLTHTHGVTEIPEELYVEETRNVEIKVEPEPAEETTSNSANVPSSSKEVLITPVNAEGKLVDLASQDVHYVIVKTEDDDVQPAPKKRKTIAVKPASERGTKNVHIDTSIPFECLQPSSTVPGEICHQMFFNCCEYSLHYRREHTKRRKPTLRCQVCEKVLDGAIAASYGADLELMARYCGACSQLCADSDEFTAHMRTHHARPKPFPCQLCHKRFTQKGGLQQHMRLHTGDRPFVCDVCNKAFTQKANLDQHQRTHTKVKPFRCVVCNKHFGQIIHLRQHMRTHTNIMPFECLECGRRFKQSSHLNFHMKSHNGIIQTETVDPSMDEESGVRYILDESMVETVQEDGESATIL